MTTNFVPDGPRDSRVVQLLYWIADPFGYLDLCAERYGHMFSIRMYGFCPFVFVSHPDALQEIFGTYTHLFDAGKSNDIIRPFAGDNSLFVIDGDRHKRDRKLMMPTFHGERIKTYAQLIVQLTEAATGQWRVGQTVSAHMAMQNITLEVILQAVFGLTEGDRYQSMKSLLVGMLDLLASPLGSSVLFFPFLQVDLGPWSPWGRTVRYRQQVHKLFQAEIEDRRRNPELLGNDVLSLMMSARDEDGELMSDDELRDEMMTLLMAGHETTATSLAWAFYWIHRLPHVREQLLAELDGAGPNADLMEIARLPYLTAVCEEALRIYPVAPISFPRIAKTPVEIMGHHFEAGTSLVPCIYLTHHREDLFADPKQFRPERFLERQYSAFEFIPFGGGHRRCVGAALAMMEMKLIVAKILMRYELVLTGEKAVVPARRGLTLAPSGGVQLRVTGQGLVRQTDAELVPPVSTV